MKDWKGSGQGVFRIIGASNHSDSKREDHDFYATSPSAVERFLEAYDVPGNIWEPSCGRGHISSALERHGKSVTSTDLIDRGYGTGGIDFFSCTRAMGDNSTTDYAIMTNPPYKFVTPYTVHAMALLSEGQQLIMFLKVTFLEGIERYRRIFSITPPRYVFVYSARAVCALGGDFEKHRQSAICYAMFVWVKGFRGDPSIKWI